MAVQDYKINYKSDFVLNINGDAGWAVPFCIKFWTGMPSQAYFVGFDGVKYVNCRVGDTPTQLMVMFDDHHLPIGPLRMQIAYHTTIEEFPGSVFDEVTNARDVIVTIDGTDYQVLLDFTGEDAPELEFDLPAYANEAERIQNELQRQQNEADRIAAELQREQATAAAVQGAENVNAQLNGTTLTVTNRQGVSTSVNTKGEQGEQGPVGPEGPQGEQGVSIVSFRQVYASETATYYSIAFSDGHEQSVAIPKGAKGDTGATGPTGPQGPQGDTGVSITGFVETGETETATLYNITFSNGTTQQVAIPKGEKGDQGEQGPEGPQGPMGDVAVITPEQQAAFTMYSEPGQNTNGPMTQKAVTDALVASAISYDNSESGIDATNVQEALDETVTKVFFEQIIEISFGKTNGSVWNYTDARRVYTGSVDGYIRSTSYINVSGIEFVMLLFLITSSAAPHCFFTDDTLTMVGSKLYNTTGDYKRFKVPAGATRLYISSSNSALCGVKFVNRYAINEVIPDMKNVTDDLGNALTFGNAPYCDFAISDENGNDILRLYNGHIKTKNFDSADVEINKYTKLEGKHLVIIGDSISSYSGYCPSGWRTYYPQGEVNDPSKTYWYQLASTLKMTYNDCSYSSSRVTGDSTITTTTGESGGCPGCSDLRINATSRDGKTPDVILIYMGVNDWAQGAPIGNFDNNASIPAEGNLTNNFSGAYALMLKKLRTLYPLSRVFCCTIPSSTRRGDTPPFIGGDATIPLQTYNDTIANVAHIMGCDVIDLAACGINYLSGGLVTVDCDSQGLNGIHPNILGHSLMYNKILTEIMAKY